jgi:hypothetical protein
MSNIKQFPWLRILIWALVLGLLASLWAEWGMWYDQFPINALWRVSITAAGGLAGWLLNLFAGNFVNMGTNVIESTGMFRFSEDAPKKIENGFIFVMSLVGAIIALIFVR